MMFEGSGMSDQPERFEEDGDEALASLFAAEEAAIRDDGFTKRVVEQAHDGISWRRTAVYGAGMAGFGVAVASIVDMAPLLPEISGWWNNLSTEIRLAEQGSIDPMAVTIAAVIAGASFMVFAMIGQER
jgi:hypothetical protein